MKEGWDEEDEDQAGKIEGSLEGREGRAGSQHEKVLVSWGSSPAREAKADERGRNTDLSQ